MSQATTRILPKPHPSTWYNYAVQVWLVNGVIQPCKHPATMRANGQHCCNADKFKGMSLPFDPDTCH